MFDLCSKQQLIVFYEPSVFYNIYFNIYITLTCNSGTRNIGSEMWINIATNKKYSKQSVGNYVKLFKSKFNIRISDGWSFCF